MSAQSPSPPFAPGGFDVTVDPLELGETMIEANAGTGKTFTLCHLVVRLVAEKDIPIEQILAVTFTNAAANELSDRIRKALVEEKEKLDAASSGSDSCDASLRLNRLRLAIASFDDARIFTIHGFCQRILNEFSFDCGVHPETELLTDDLPILTEISDDFRRARLSTVAPVTAALSLGKRLTAQKMIDAFRERAEEEEEEDVSAASGGGEESESAASEKGWNEQEVDLAYRTVLTSWMRDQLAIAEFTEKALYGNAKAKTRFPQLSKRFRKAAQRDYPDAKLIELLYECFEKPPRMKKEHGAGEEPEFFALAEAFVKDCSTLEGQIIRSFIRWCETKLPQTKEAMNVRTFDDLQELVATGLEGKMGKSLAKKVSLDYGAALIDEFQDTDPLQFKILRNLFQKEMKEKYVYYIGDPKQSIFAFRGADLDNYLSIREQLPSRSVKSLLVNYRSHPDLVEGANSFFQLGGAEQVFGDDRIVFHSSGTHAPNREKKKFSRITGDLPTAPLQVRFLESDKDDTAKKTERSILADLTKEVVRLLDGQSTIGGEPLKGSGIAVLCQSHAQARSVLDNLAKRNVPCVLHSTRNVFETDEAEEIEIVMDALLEPHRADAIRKALSIRLMGLNASRIVGLETDAEAWDNLVAQFFRWRDLWRKKGFYAAFRIVLNGEWKKEVDEALGKRSDGKPEGDAQNVSARTLSYKGGERRMANYIHLAELLHGAENQSCPTPRSLRSWYLGMREKKDGSDEFLVRLESDEQAVQIMTVHHSKGLEYPVTFCPFTWKPAKNAKLEDAFNEHVRLLYVALTRGSSRSYLYFKAEKSFGKSSLSRIFGTDSPVETLEQWAQACPQLVGLQPADGSQPTENHRSSQEEDEGSALKAKEFKGSIPSGYSTTSYSNLMKKRTILEKDRDSEDPHPESVPMDQRQGAFLFPAGSKTGDFFHSVLEDIDFREFDHHDVIVERLHRHGLTQADPKLAASIIEAALRADLPDGRGNSFRLTELAPGDRLNELGFHFTVGEIRFKELGERLSNDGMSGLFIDYLRQVPESIAVGGEEFIKGFIDLTFRRDHRYFILDWKSNLLGGRQETFRQDRLAETMRTTGYLMQYHLYMVALHRHLRNSLPDYDYDLHVGGAHYLFIRGMLDPGQDGDGVFFDRPDKALVERLDQALAPSEELPS